MKIKNMNKFLILLLASMLVTVVYFSPLVLGSFRGYKPELRFLGDLQIACYPAYIQAGKYFTDFAYYGIDFFTANGSSSFFNRPNLSSYYLPQLLLQSVVRVYENTNETKLFAIQLWLNAILAMLFTAIWLNKFMKIDVLPALLGGALFFSLVSNTYGQVAFFNVACIFPALMYAFTYSLRIETDWYQKVLLSVPLVVIVTAGYLPIAIMGVCIAIFASISLTEDHVDDDLKYKDFYWVLAIASFILISYLVTIVKAVQIVPTIPKVPLIEAVFFADLALTFKGVIYLFIASAPNDSGEGPHFRLGIPILILLYVSYSHVFALGNNWKRNTSITCFVIFLLSILLGMGRVSGFADVFFYTVPGLGGMHSYQRYMLISVFFLVFALILGLSELYKSEKPLSLKIPTVALAVTFFLILLFPDLLIKNSISVPLLFTECFISVLVLFTLNLRGDNRFWLLLIPILIFHQGSFVYMSSNWASTSNPGTTSIDVVNSESRMNDLTNYFYANTNKTLVKYIDLTPEIEKVGGVPQNFPWFIRYKKNEDRRISSYMGYDQGLSQQLEYAQKFSYFGKFDKNYLIESGADYIIYDEKTRVKENKFIEDMIDSSVPEHVIGNGFFASKVRLSNNSIALPVFDNGIFKVYSKESNFEVVKFKTNWSSKIEFDFNSSQPSKIYFQLFPHKYWQYRINGSLIRPNITPSGLASFDIPSGSHKVTVRYSNLPNLFFVYSYLIYILLIAFILFRYAVIKINERK